jgi:competence protein ComGG
MNNEKGFVFPMVLIIATSVLLLIGYMIDQFVLDKRFYKEVEENLISAHLLRLAVHDLQQEWSQMEDVTINNGIVFYPKGDVYYEIITQDDRQAEIIFYGSTMNERKAIVMIHYDKSLRKVIAWIEN